MFRTFSLSIFRSYSLYTQQWYMPYRFVDNFRAESGWNCWYALDSYKQKKYFLHPTRPALGPTQLPMHLVLDHSRGKSGRGVALTIQPHLAPRLKKEYTYTTAPPLCLHGRIHYVFIYYFPHFSSPFQKFKCTIISSEIDRMWFTWKAECGTVWIPHAQINNMSGNLEVYELCCFHLQQSVSFYINATEKLM
jgi:hypothetical protein